MYIVLLIDKFSRRPDTFYMNLQDLELFITLAKASFCVASIKVRYNWLKT